MRVFVLRSIFLFIFFGIAAQANTASKRAKVCPAVPADAMGSVANSTPGCFDYYVFAQFWLPEICVNNASLSPPPGGVCQNLSKTFLNEPNPHGLWPNFNVGRTQLAFPVDCTTEPFEFEKLSFALRMSLKQLYPRVIKNLPDHEWSKHGTCAGKSQEAYFQSVVDYNRRVNQKVPVLMRSIGKAVSYQALAKAYGGDSFVSLQCNQYGKRGQYLSKIQTYWNRDGKQIKRVFDGVPNVCMKSKPIHIRKVHGSSSLRSWMETFGEKYGKKTNVGFDIDDTVLFSSPAFFYLTTYKRLSLSDQNFWNQLNGGLDKFSLPKKSVLKLLRFHENRRDNIYFITARKSSQTEKVSSILKSSVAPKAKYPVVFTNFRSKAKFIRERNIKVYYGDSDTDISSAIDANIRGVRIQRSSSSLGSSPAFPGFYGETILLETAF